MAAQRTLIVNADDFGQSPGVNAGVAAAHESGILTSASLMVRWPAAGAAAAYARSRPDLSVGLHFDLGEWAYSGGVWGPVYEVVPPDDETAVARELDEQLAAFRRLLGRDPTHLDSHQHVHRREPVRSACLRVADRLGIPLRHFSPEVSYRGEFYGQTRDGSASPRAISVDGLIEVLVSLHPGTSELACHPGLGDDLTSMYLPERTTEVRTLCDPRVREALLLAGISLASFAAFRSPR
jgi:predicted glycoside hydrolase/deacetylase ChbG (UPF0249 family)